MAGAAKIPEPDIRISLLAMCRAHSRGRTVGDSNPALIINHFLGKIRACLRMFTKLKMVSAIFAGGANAQLSIYILYAVVIFVNFVCHQLTSSLQELPIINMSH